MIKLTNRIVQEDLYKFLLVENDPDFWIVGNYKNEWGITLKNDETMTTFYPYPNRVSAEKDFIELKRIKTLCKQ